MSDGSFDLAVFLVACARDALEAPAVYGAHRMLESVARLGDHHDDPFLAEIRDRIRGDSHLVMQDRDAFVRRLDGLLADVAGEALTRNRRLLG